MAMKLTNLRVDETCAACYGRTPMATTAWWDSSRSQVICTRCRPVDFEPIDATAGATIARATAPPLTVGVTAAGGSSQTAESLVRDRPAQRSGDISAPRHVTAWEGRAKEERNLGTYLDEISAGRAVVLHGRRLPDSKLSIDHLVIAPNGIWVIDATNYGNRIGYRTSDWVRPAADRHDGSRRENKLVAGMATRCETVRSLVDSVGTDAVPVRSAVCFTHSHWPGRDHVENVHEVIVAPPIALGAVLTQDGWVEPDAINEIATRLTAGLPPAPDPR